MSAREIVSAGCVSQLVTPPDAASDPGRLAKEMLHAVLEGKRVDSMRGT